VFQAYYEEVLLRDKSLAQIAFNSLQYALVFLPGLAIGRLFDLGHFKVPYFIASCVLVACNFLVAESTQWYQFFLAQGIGIGLCSGIVFGPVSPVISHWFQKKKGLALGLTAVGSSVGGTVFPIAAGNLLPLVGFKWTVRIFRFMLLATLGAANLLMERRLPPVNVQGGLFNPAAFRNPAYALYRISGTFTFLGLYTGLTYLPVSAVRVGVSSDFAFYLLAMANASSADKIGPLNIIIPFTAVAGVTTFAWPYATTSKSLVAIAIVYGFSCGTYVTLFAAPAMAIGGVTDVGRRAGMFTSFAAFGALGGPPISGAINSATRGFVQVSYYAGM
ncbi:hypothetical protein HYDPIDRAFT_100251, partial [Hydnomerulius pinastri MD-312]